MTIRARRRFLSFTVLIAGTLWGGELAKDAKGVLWREPVDIESRNLLYGSGGKNDSPADGPFVFLKENLDGTNPKFTVRDASGIKWKVKLGAEAKPEVAATRLVWAAGYSTDEDYFMDRAELTEVPFEHLRRLKGRISSDSIVKNARFEREPKGTKKQDDSPSWSWKSSESLDSREVNGLKTIMALINNWDLKAENNAVYDGPGESKLYVVSDLGAAFGPSNIVVGVGRSRGNLNAYEHSHFITHKTAERVDFATPGFPTFFLIFAKPWNFFARIKMESIGHHVPRTDAKWIGSILARLSPAQIRDAFRAAQYSPEAVERFARVVESRIAELNAL